MAVLSQSPATTILDADGNPLAGGLVYTSASGTDNPINTFTDYAGTISATNPIVLDASGSAIIYLAVGLTYRFKITDSNGGIIRVVDGICGVSNILNPDNTPSSIVQGYVNAAAAYAQAAANSAASAATSATSATDSAAAALTSQNQALSYAEIAYADAISAQGYADQAYNYINYGLGSIGQGVQAWDLGYIEDQNPLFVTDLGYITNPSLSLASPDVVPNSTNVSASSYQSLQLRRGLIADGRSTIGAPGELFYLQDVKTIQINDGVTPGGVFAVTTTNPDSITLGSISGQNANSVRITGGSITNVSINTLTTPLAITDGGTGSNSIDSIKKTLGLGTAVNFNVGNSATNVVQLDANAKLPAIDGSQLLNLPNTGGGGGSYSAYAGFRQTIISGPNALVGVGSIFNGGSGYARPASYIIQNAANVLQISLPITDLTNANTPYIVSAAGGGSTNNTNDRVVQIKTGIGWRFNAGTDTGKRYLYIDIDETRTPTLGASILPPTYVAAYEQIGAAGWNTPLILNQHYFDYTSMKMYLCVSQGSPATLQLQQVWRVFVGEVTLSNTAITSQIQYAYSGQQTSGYIRFATTDTSISFNHNIGAPTLLTGYNRDGSVLGQKITYFDNPQNFALSYYQSFTDEKLQTVNVNNEEIFTLSARGKFSITDGQRDYFTPFVARNKTEVNIKQQFQQKIYNNTFNYAVVEKAFPLSISAKPLDTSWDFYLICKRLF